MARAHEHLVHVEQSSQLAQAPQGAQRDDMEWLLDVTWQSMSPSLNCLSQEELALPQGLNEVLPQPFSRG